jgi:hypothetical protein
LVVVDVFCFVGVMWELLEWVSLSAGLPGGHCHERSAYRLDGAVRVSVSRRWYRERGQLGGRHFEGVREGHDNGAAIQGALSVFDA